ncbi:MAG TPA: SMP-30/gluconolactonase/LRE family protein, partial [Arenibacter sp.]|nr:SMP-30/gluconolactonase/LRE family protein [Arenibacter sp.]
MLIEVVSEVKSELGEGPVWDAPRGLICWVDIINGLIHEWLPEKKVHHTIKVGQMIGAMAVCTDGNYVAALKNGFGFIDRRTGEVDLITDPEADLPDNRFNDGKCDPSGRFWAGSLPLSEDTDTGSLYILNRDRSVEKREDKITISNGLAWSLTDRAFYYIDTPTMKVVRYDYDNGTGAIGNKETIINIP